MSKRRRQRKNRRRNKNIFKENDAQINNSIVVTPAATTFKSAVTPIRNIETPRCIRSNSLTLQKKINNEVAHSRRSSLTAVYNLNAINLKPLFETVPEKSPIMIDISTQTVHFDNSLQTYEPVAPRAGSHCNLFHIAKKMMSTDSICVSNFNTHSSNIKITGSLTNPFFKHRCYKNMYPNVARNGYAKVCCRKEIGKAKRRLSNEYEIPKSFTPIKRRSPIQRCAAHSTQEDNPSFVYGRFYSSVHLIHKYSTKFAKKLLELCAWFGLTIKMGLDAVYKPKVETTMSTHTEVRPAEVSPNEIYNIRITHLENKIVEMQAEIDELKTNAADIQRIKQDFEGLKEMLKNRSGCSDNSFVPPPPPPPPPMMRMPPPPPPPLPPPLLLTNAPAIRIVRSNANQESKKESNARPNISLDDILKVKLRKSGERQPTPRSARRNSSQPVVSMDMLREVKLRPVTRASTLTSFPTLNDAVTSPSSGLSRILNPQEKPRLQA